MSDELLRKLEERLGPLHARQRLGIEKDHEAQVFGQGLTFFHLENWYSAPFIIRTILKLADLYRRARRNAESIGGLRFWTANRGLSNDELGQPVDRNPDTKRVRRQGRYRPTV